MNEEIKTKVGYVTPLKRICMTIGELPSSYLESMTYYEMLVWFTNYIQKTLIPTINNNAEAVTELQNLFNELQNYVDNYFDNLNVQEEIDNKLDKMVEDGTLQEIISIYLNSKAIFGYDNVSEMKQATNLQDGSYARTLGYYNKNDKGGSLYKIRTITNNDVIDDQFIIALNNENLIAELILEKELNILCLGAKNDGTEEVNSIITNALNKVKNLYFPRGVYYIEDTIELSNSVTLRGENMELSRLVTDKDKPIITIDGKYFCNISDLEFKGSNQWDNSQEPTALKTNQNLINIRGSFECEFKNIYVNEAEANGVYIDRNDSGTSIQINFEHIYIKNNSKNGMVIRDVHGCKITKGNCEYNGQSNIVLESYPTDINISNLNFNFTNNSKDSVLKIDCINVLSNIKIDGLHIEDMSEQTPVVRNKPCLDIKASMLDLSNLYIRYESSQYNQCVKISGLSKVSFHDSIIRNAANPITLPDSYGCMIRNIRTYDTTGTYLTGRGANYTDNQVDVNSSTIIGADGSPTNYYAIGGINYPRSYNYTYSGTLLIVGGTATTGNFYMSIYNKNNQLLDYQTISLESFDTNKKLDITNALRDLSNIGHIKISIPPALTAQNCCICISVDTI